MNTEYTKAELVALNTYLSYWPDGMSYDDVLARLNADDARRDDSNDAIDVVGDYEDLWADHVAQLIASLHDYCVSIYGE